MGVGEHLLSGGGGQLEYLEYWRNRIAKRLITVGGVREIVHDVPTGQPTVAEPLINYGGHPQLRNMMLRKVGSDR